MKDRHDDRRDPRDDGPTPDDGRDPADRDLPGMVDDIEERLEEERAREGVGGNIEERRRTPVTEPDHQAPD